MLENRGETSNDGTLRTFDLVASEQMANLRNRLVIGWRSPRTWRINATAAAGYPVVEIADAEPIPFPGFDALTLDYRHLQAVMREHRYASWRTAGVGGRDLPDHRHKRRTPLPRQGRRRGEPPPPLERYAANGHGGNVELRNISPTSLRFSLLLVFDPATPSREIDAAESHFKHALDSRRHGLNRN